MNDIHIIVKCPNSRKLRVFRRKGRSPALNYLSFINPNFCIGRNNLFQFFCCEDITVIVRLGNFAEDYNRCEFRVAGD